MLLQFFMKHVWFLLHGIKCSIFIFDVMRWTCLKQKRIREKSIPTLYAIQFQYTLVYDWISIFFSGEKDIILLGDFNLEPDKEGEALAIGQCECWS